MIGEAYKRVSELYKRSIGIIQSKKQKKLRKNEQAIQVKKQTIKIHAFKKPQEKKVKK